MARLLFKPCLLFGTDKQAIHFRLIIEFDKLMYKGGKVDIIREKEIGR